MFPLKRSEITAMNVLIFMFNGKTEKFADRESFSKALNHAYAFRAYSNLSGYGDQVLFDIRFSWISGKLVNEPGYLDEITDLMDQILFHPVLNEKNLEEAKYLLENRLNMAEQDPDTATVRALLNALPSDLPISIPVQGIRDEIASVSLEQIRALFKKISETPFEIYGVGAMETEIQNYLSSLSETEYAWKPSLLVDLSSPVRTEQERDIAQSSLALLYSTSVSPDSPTYFALMLANGILGASPMSLLFEEVREKHSFCYSISSSLIRFDGGLLILTGTQRKNIDEVRELIAAQISRLQHASTEIEPDRLENAKLDLIDSLRTQQDSAQRMIGQSFMNDYLRRPMSFDQMVEAIRKVTLEDIEKSTAQLKLVGESVVLQSREETQESEQDELNDLKSAIEISEGAENENRRED